jgi:hypothetical protein
MARRRLPTMVFDKRATVMTLSQPAKDCYLWAAGKAVWVHMAHTPKANLFSKVGIGVKTVVFTMRKTPGINLHYAIAYRGRQYFITDINSDDPVLMIITAADIQPMEFSAFGMDEHEGEHKSPVYAKREISRFPACLTEKYVGFKQDDPMSRTEETFVLVTPKSILLQVHDLVKRGIPPDAGEKDERPILVVKACHTLDEHKNEYEITRKDDV